MHSIVYPPTINYDWMFQRPQQLMRQFARLGWKSYYMNLPAPGIPLALNSIEIREKNLCILNDVQTPEYYIADKPILYFSCPRDVDQIGKLNEKYVIFDNLDEPTAEFEVWKPWYDKAMQSADLVLCTSERLYQQTRSQNKILVPNGADYEHFASAQDGTLPIPADIKPYTNFPIVGYYGALATWVDWELIKKLASSLSMVGGRLILIGPNFNTSSMVQASNIHYLGLKEYNTLPSYLQTFNVSIIPFSVTPLIESCNPVKMWEYLSAGKPVVATAMPEAMKHKEIRIGHTHEEFIDHVLSVLIKGDNGKEARIALAKENSWEARAKTIMKEVDRCFQL